MVPSCAHRFTGISDRFLLIEIYQTNVEMFSTEGCYNMTITTEKRYFQLGYTTK